MSESLAANISALVKVSASEIYHAWIDPRILPLWLAPPPYDMIAADVDARVGGQYRHDVKGPQGDHHVVTGKYLEAEPGRRILKSWIYSGPNPAPRPEATFVQVDLVEGASGSSGAASGGNRTAGGSLVATDNVAASSATTQVTIKHYGLRDETERKHYQEGWEHCLRRLRELKAKQ